MLTFNSLALGLLAASSLLNVVQGHGYLATPRSRNYVANQDGTWGSAVGVPQTESCPHCLNTKEATNFCGKGNADTNYDDWYDANGVRMPWDSQETYTAGQNITVEVFLDTNHAG